MSATDTRTAATRKLYEALEIETKRICQLTTVPSSGAWCKSFRPVLRIASSLRCTQASFMFVLRAATSIVDPEIEPTTTLSAQLWGL